MTNKVNNKFLKYILILAGSLSLALGIIGIILPVMPTTVFLLISAACYAKSSDKFYNWLMNNRYFGKLIRNYREKRGVPIKAKRNSIIFLWITIGISVFLINLLWVQILLIIIAISVTIHILKLKTYVEQA